MASHNRATGPGRSRLGRELSLALAFKALVLALLWFAFFRPEPGRPKPEAADLFAPPASSIVQQENLNDQR